MSSTQIDDEPPSPSKLELIRRFLKATGIQHRIDSGSFVERHAFPGGMIFASAARQGRTFGDAARVSSEVLHAAYAEHRHVWQQEYESHINWEFAEEELQDILNFLERPVGQHFLEGRWRMDAYINTNTESLVEQIVREAETRLKRP